MIRATLVGLLVLASSGCRSAPALPRAASVRIRPPADRPGDFQWRQTVAVRYGEEDPRSFDAVLEKTGNELRLVGITPLGTVTFLAEARDTTVRFENRTGRALPFDGSHILLDVQRVFFPWLDGPFVNGHREGIRDALAIRERAVDGQLVERSFSDAEGPVATVRYLEPGDPAPVAELIGHRFGYVLSLRTERVE